MNAVLSGLMWQVCLVYLVDIVIRPGTHQLPRFTQLLGRSRLSRQLQSPIKMCLTCPQVLQRNLTIIVVFSIILLSKELMKPTEMWGAVYPYMTEILLSCLAQGLHYCTQPSKTKLSDKRMSVCGFS
jgi:hypothetical protein